MDSGRKELGDVHMKDENEMEHELRQNAEDLYEDQENKKKLNDVPPSLVRSPVKGDKDSELALKMFKNEKSTEVTRMRGMFPAKEEAEQKGNENKKTGQKTDDTHNLLDGRVNYKPNQSPPRLPLQPKQPNEHENNEDEGRRREPSNSEETDPEDRYKPEGTVRLDIDRFSDFSRGLPADNAQRLSDPVFIRGMPWKILAIPREGNRSPARSSGKCLGFFLQCNGESGTDQDNNWSCMASAQLRVCSQREGIEHHVRRISHTFHPKENDWGYSQFITCETLLDDNNGFIKNDTVRLEVDVTADAPHGVHWDSKKHAGFIGLRNQGATCYMNSILQTLFFTNKLRKAVYLMPTEEDDQDSSVALAMQRVFYELQFSDSPVGTRKLTKSFGWDAVDSFLQHDVQELCRVLLDNLESKMANTGVQDTIPKLFKGLMRSYVRCIDVSFESSRDEPFYDLSLKVRGLQNVIESFRDYTEPETLEGDNLYDAGDLGMQRAEKGVKFVAFPSILHLQLMRFQYDPQLDTNVKINDKFEFPEVLHLNEFIDECGTQDDYTYLLQAVLVHAGDFHGGHYVVYINTNLRSDTPRWCKYDDDVVARCPTREAVVNNYGGDESEGAGRSCSNAYMLVYVQQNKISDVLCPVQERDIPRHLRTRFENEKEEEQIRRREREQATLYCDVTLVTDDNLADHHGFDIGDYDAIKTGRSGSSIRIPKTSNVREFYNKVGEALNLPVDGIRLWRYDVVYGKDDGFTTSLESHRPRICIFYQPDEVMLNTTVLEPKGDNIFYVEIGKPLPLGVEPQTQPNLALNSYDRDTSILAFIKLYEPSRKKFTYVGSIVFSLDDPLTTYYPTINSMVGLPRDAKLNLYLEVAPDHIYQICTSDQAIRNDRNLVVDGIIIIVENSEAVTEENNCSVACNKMFAHMQIEAIPNNDCFSTSLNSASDVFYLDLQMDSSLKELCDALGQRLDYDPKKIVLWRSTSPTERPGSVITQEDFQRCTMHDLISTGGNFIHDPRNCRPYTIYYSKIPIPFEELSNHTHCRVALMDYKFQIKEVSVFPHKTEKVKNILDGAMSYFDYAPNGTKRLRLVHVSSTPSQSRVYQVLDNDIPVNSLTQRMMCHTLAPTASAATMRVEEIPLDQLTIGPNEYLLPVSHYEKEPNKMFGVPFLIKIVDGEPVANIKKRVKEALGVQDREFEKFKFSLIANNRILRELDQADNAIVNLNEFRTASPNAFNSPILGIDHANKSRTNRTHHAEKAIVIHN